MKKRVTFDEWTYNRLNKVKNHAQELGVPVNTIPDAIRLCIQNFETNPPKIKRKPKSKKSVMFI